MIKPQHETQTSNLILIKVKLKQGFIAKGYLKN